MCLGTIIVKTFLLFFCNIICVFRIILSSPKCVLAAHHKFLFFIINLFFLSNFTSLILLVNFKFPKNFTLLAFKFNKFFFESLLAARHKSKHPKIFFENCGKNFHFSKVFLVILPFIKIRGIFLLFISVIKLGHISESTRIASFGFHSFKNLSTKIGWSIGKYLWVTLEYFSNSFLNNSPELFVDVVTKKLVFFFFLSIFFNKEIMLKNSPILAA